MGKQGNSNFVIDYKIPLSMDLDQLGDATDFIDSGTKKIMIRLPKQLHEALKKQAHECETSLNLLCISKLIAPIPKCPILKCEINPLFNEPHWRKPNGIPQGT